MSVNKPFFITHILSFLGNHTYRLVHLNESTKRNAKNPSLSLEVPKNILEKWICKYMKVTKTVQGYANVHLFAKLFDLQKVFMRIKVTHQCDNTKHWSNWLLLSRKDKDCQRLQPTFKILYVGYDQNNDDTSAPHSYHNTQMFFISFAEKNTETKNVIYKRSTGKNVSQKRFTCSWWCLNFCKQTAVFPEDFSTGMVLTIKIYFCPKQREIVKLTASWEEKKIKLKSVNIHTH